MLVLSKNIDFSRGNYQTDLSAFAFRFQQSHSRIRAIPKVFGQEGHRPQVRRCLYAYDTYSVLPVWRQMKWKC